MRRAERLFRIVSLFRDGAVRTAADLATALEVSERTIYRDIAHLQGSGIGLDGVAGLGYVADANLDLPPLNFSIAELEAVKLGLSFVVQSGDAEMVADARAALGKIGDALPKGRSIGELPTSRIVRRKSARAPALAARLRQAIRNRRVCEIVYDSPEGRPESRLVHPLVLTAYSDSWTLGAWCELRQAFRDFRLDRIKSLRLADFSFSAESGRDLADYLRHRGSERDTGD